MIGAVESTKEKILNADAYSLAAEIKNGNLSSFEITQTYIKHIQKHNPSINAVVEDRYIKALEEAKKYDRLVKENQFIGPLHGVPISIKESIHVQGMKTTGGLINRSDLISKTDAEVVRRLKKAGAIILAKTNTPILCFCQETDNKLYGRTNNPWNLERTAGGSSGGEAALLSIGGAAAGLGSDIGGSIRFPSHFNGVIGFKPSKYHVSQTGHYPPSVEPLQKRMMSIGPMGKSVRDMQLLYRVIAQQTHSPKKLQDYTIEFLPDKPIFPLSEQTQKMYKNVKNTLSSYTINEAIPPYFEDSALLWQEIMSIDGGKSIQRKAFSSDKPNIVKEYIKEKTTGNSAYHHYFTWALIGAKLFKPSKQRKQEINKIINDGDKTINFYLKNRILILPVYHQGALKHGEVYKDIFSIRKTYKTYLPYIAYANVWGLPSLTIPVGKDENDMPVSLQVISRSDNEAALFQLGEILEENFRGYIRCTHFD